jgi:hypothetical protein
MWDMIAKEMELPWRAVESMHWQMGQEDLAGRANVPVFQPHIATSSSGTLKQGTASSSNKRKISKSPPTVGSDSSHGRGTPSSALARTRRRHSGPQHNSSPSRKRTDSKTDKTGLEPYSGAVGEHDLGSTSASRHPSTRDDIASPSTPSIHLSHEVKHEHTSHQAHLHHPPASIHARESSAGSAGPTSTSDRDWVPSTEQAMTATESTPRGRSASLEESIRSSQGAGTPPKIETTAAQTEQDEEPRPRVRARR